MQNMKVKRLGFLSVVSVLVYLKQNILYMVFLICVALNPTFSISALTFMSTLNNSFYKEKCYLTNRQLKEGRRP